MYPPRTVSPARTRRRKHMLSREEHEILTRVGLGKPLGEVLRRYWQPVGLSELVTSKLQRMKVLGEELLLYRGASGKAVATQLRCAHRASRSITAASRAIVSVAPITAGSMTRTANASSSRRSPKAAVSRRKSGSQPIRRRRSAVSSSPIWAQARRRCCRPTISSTRPMASKACRCATSTPIG